MKTNLLKIAIFAGSLAFCSTSFATNTIIIPGTLLDIDDGAATPVVLATVRTSTGVTMAAETSDTAYGVVAKHLGGDTVYGATNDNSTVRVIGTKDPDTVGQVPTGGVTITAGVATLDPTLAAPTQ